MIIADALAIRRQITLRIHPPEVNLISPIPENTSRTIAFRLADRAAAGIVNTLPLAIAVPALLLDPRYRKTA
jgi:hypothetical protein